MESRDGVSLLGGVWGSSMHSSEVMPAHLQPEKSFSVAGNLVESGQGQAML